MVKVLAGIGMPEVEMVNVIINPQTKRPISPITLRKHFREELDQGFVQANSAVAAGLYANATKPTDTHPGGNPSAQMFWLKCRLGWQQNPEKHKPALPPALETAVNDLDTARRLAFLFAKAAG